MNVMANPIDKLKAVLFGKSPPLTGWTIESYGQVVGQIGDPTYYSSGFQYYRLSSSSPLPDDLDTLTVVLRSPADHTLTTGDFELSPAEENEVRIRISKSGHEKLKGS